jgi:hypothetical protein
MYYQMEGWPSGLRRTLGKRVMGKTIRGFESPSFRHLLLLRHSAIKETQQNHNQFSIQSIILYDEQKIQLVEAKKSILTN